MKDSLPVYIAKKYKGQASVEYGNNGNDGYLFPVKTVPTREQILVSLYPPIRPRVLDIIEKEEKEFCPTQFVLLSWRSIHRFSWVENEITRAGLAKPSLLQVISFWLTYPGHTGQIIFMHTPVIHGYPNMDGRPKIGAGDPCSLCCNFALRPGGEGTKNRYMFFVQSAQSTGHDSTFAYGAVTSL
ncbi:MAG: hypothetical protein WDZ88_00060 [Candidatus Paceibacterota bacterium]